MISYMNYFNDLATLCPGMVTLEYKKVQRYIWGLPQPIERLVPASKLTTNDSAKRVAFSLTNQEIRCGTTVQKDDLQMRRSNKRKVGRDTGVKVRRPLGKKHEVV